MTEKEIKETQELLKRHRELQVKSIEQMACFRVHRGYYYYKGYFMSFSEDTECWSYGADQLIDYECAKTMKECKNDIDWLTKGKTKLEIANDIIDMYKRKEVEFANLLKKLQQNG